jgi:hypothetical protein
MSETESRRNGRASRLSDRLNPILVLELRRMFHSRAFEMMLLGFLGAAVTVMGYGLIEARRRGPDAELGRDVFVWLLALLLIAGLFVVPLYAGVRLFLDRGTDRMNLIAITGLRVDTILRGRLQASFLVPLLLLATIAPLALLCLLLRGVGWLSILIALGVAIVFSFPALMLTLCLGSIATGWVSRLVCVLIGAVGLLIHGLIGSFTALSVATGYDDSGEIVLFTFAVIGGYGVPVIFGLLIADSVALVRFGRSPWGARSIRMSDEIRELLSQDPRYLKRISAPEPSNESQADADAR